MTVYGSCNTTSSVVLGIGKYLNVYHDCGCGTVVERVAHDQTDMGSDLAGCWAVFLLFTFQLAFEY